ncbi:MAG: hypothetical protein QM680_14405 [Luteolibacter sp.]
MKSVLYYLLWMPAVGPAGVFADTYTNFIRQVQYPSNVVWDMDVEASGAKQSALVVEDGGAQFQLHAVNSATLAAYVLDAKYVGAYVPIAQISIRSEDPYATIPRTRAGRPFYVDITITGLLSGEAYPAASKEVTFLHHVQSYGEGGTGVNLDRTQATLVSQESITTNLDADTRTYRYSVVPAADVAKIRGEERFSVFTIQDTRETYSIEPSQLASQYIQIWPVPEGTISGIAMNGKYKDLIPTVTFGVKDVYPGSQIYAQAYQGGVNDNPSDPVQVAAANAAVYATPTDASFSSTNLSGKLPVDGQWTVELISSSPFGLERLDYVTFDIDRTISVRGSMTTAE